MTTEKKITIVDYGFGNIFSLQKAFAYLGVSATVSAKVEDLDTSDALIIPGVGAFGDGIDELRKRNLEEPIMKAAAASKPILGICLGMQFLFEKSFEFGEHQGLGLIRGVVDKIDIKNGTCRVPHMGWGKLLPPNHKRFEHNILADLGVGDRVYFVHSYTGTPTAPDDIIAKVCYCESEITAAVAKKNIIGVQFHPEKSGPIGLKILKNFIEIVIRN